MRVASWNVNGLRARLEFLLLWLAERRPDLVALQEIKLTEEQFPREPLERAGYGAVIHGQPGWNGVAILGREPATPIQVGLPGEGEQGARLVSAEIGGLELTSVYCPNGKSVGHPDYPRKLAWMLSLARWWSGRAEAGRPALVGGDFNVCPAPIDSWDETALAGTIFHTEAERARWRALLALGLHDTFRELHPERRAFSWWDYRGGAFHRGRGLRIDFLLASPALMSRVRAVEIDRDWRKKKEGLTPSDHAPVVLDLD